MDAFKVLGVSEGSLRGPNDLEKVRQRSKELYKRLAKEKRDIDAKRVLEAFELVKNKFRSKDASKNGGAEKKSSAEKTNGKAPDSTKSASIVVGASTSPASKPSAAAAKPAVATAQASKSRGDAKSQRPNGQAHSDRHSRRSGASGAGAVARGGGAAAPARGSTSVQKLKRQPSELERPRSNGTAAGNQSMLPGGAASVLPGTAQASKRALTPLPGSASSQQAAKRRRTSTGGVVTAVASNGAAPKANAARPTVLTCTCGQSYKPQSLPRVVPTTGGFVCPACRVRGMDPLNPLLEGGRGLLKLIVIQHPLVPKDARTEAKFKFHLNLPRLQQWRKLGQNVEVRMCLLNNFEAHHVWPKTMTFKVNGRQLFKVDPPTPGHKRRDVPQRISPHLKSDKKNVAEVTLGDACVQRYALAVVRTSPQLPRQLCKHVQVMKEDDCKLRVHNILFNSMLEGSAQEVQCEGNDRCRLICPITLARIDTPVRGRKCSHLQCFDLQGYMLANMRMGNYCNRWHCPVCDLVLRPPKDLFVDTYMMKVLGSTAGEDEEIAFDEVGGFRVTAKAEPVPQAGEEEEESEDDFPAFLCYGNEAQAIDEDDAVVAVTTADASPAASSPTALEGGGSTGTSAAAGEVDGFGSLGEDALLGGPSGSPDADASFIGLETPAPDCDDASDDDEGMTLGIPPNTPAPATGFDFDEEIDDDEASPGLAASPEPAASPDVAGAVVVPYELMLDDERGECSPNGDAVANEEDCGDIMATEDPYGMLLMDADGDVEVNGADAGAQEAQADDKDADTGAVASDGVAVASDEEAAVKEDLAKPADEHQATEEPLLESPELEGEEDKAEQANEELLLESPAFEEEEEDGQAVEEPLLESPAFEGDDEEAEKKKDKDAEADAGKGKEDDSSSGETDDSDDGPKEGGFPPIGGVNAAASSPLSDAGGDSRKRAAPKVKVALSFGEEESSVEDDA